MINKLLIRHYLFLKIDSQEETHLQEDYEEVLKENQIMHYYLSIRMMRGSTEI